MENKKILTRDNTTTNELTAVVKKEYKGVKIEFNEFYYLDYAVDETTGLINNESKVKYYTKKQMERNIKAMKNAYHIAKGAASPNEIIDFRNKYNISASMFSLILGFSKNTISNIENEGITSLSSGRLIKMCLENKKVVYKYVQLCDAIDKAKKEEISRRLMEEFN